MSTETKKLAAMSRSEQPCSRNVWGARNWPDGMRRDAMNDIGELSLFRADLCDRITDDAGDRRGLRKALLLHQESKRAITAAPDILQQYLAVHFLCCTQLRVCRRASAESRRGIVRPRRRRIPVFSRESTTKIRASEKRGRTEH